MITWLMLLQRNPNCYRQENRGRSWFAREVSGPGAVVKAGHGLRFRNPEASDSGRFGGTVVGPSCFWTIDRNPCNSPNRTNIRGSLGEGGPEFSALQRHDGELI